MHSISKISKNGTYLQVIWDDGKESKFNYMWLRDNCPTAHDKDSRHRMFNILDTLFISILDIRTILVVILTNNLMLINLSKNIKSTIN